MQNNNTKVKVYTKKTIIELVKEINIKCDSTISVIIENGRYQIVRNNSAITKRIEAKPAYYFLAGILYSENLRHTTKNHETPKNNGIVLKIPEDTKNMKNFASYMLIMHPMAIRINDRKIFSTIHKNGNNQSTATLCKFASLIISYYYIIYMHHISGTK